MICVYVCVLMMVNRRMRHRVQHMNVFGSMVKELVVSSGVCVSGNMNI